MPKKYNDPELLLDSHRGIYIPQNFAEECLVPELPFGSWSGVSKEDRETLLEGPDGEWYWEAWANVLDHAIFTDRYTGETLTLHQEEDVWVVPSKMEWSEDINWFVWSEETE